jgi:molybdate transport system substrate-binding protein
MRAIVPGLVLALASLPAAAETVRVAVASNFAGTLAELTAAFEAGSDHQVQVSTGSTGKHYAQIRNGAPFDLFFAADSRRPRLLEEEGHAVAGSRFTYAEGRIVLYSPDPEAFEDGRAALEAGAFQRLAIANPELAPYGLAAKQALTELGVWSTWEPRLIRGENIGQTQHFVQSGNVEAGVVALSQVVKAGGSQWTVPGDLHEPIRQQAVTLHAGTDKGAVAAFLDFLRSAEGARIIRDFGYSVPE